MDANLFNALYSFLSFNNFICEFEKFSFGLIGLLAKSDTVNGTLAWVEIILRLFILMEDRILLNIEPKTSGLD